MCTFAATMAQPTPTATSDAAALPTIGVIGAGKIGQALIRGLLHGQVLPREQICATTGTEASLQRLEEETGIRCLRSNLELARTCKVIILAVKPYRMARVLRELDSTITREHLVITLGTGFTPKDITEHLTSRPPVIWAMPNTPMQVQEGVVTMCAGDRVTSEHRQLADTLFRAVGQTVWLEEHLMHGATALSGAGPAYMFLIIDALAEAGVRMGLPRELATLMAAQTMKGTAILQLESGQAPAVLKAMVTTPAGVTVEGLNQLEENGIRTAFMRAVTTATERSKEIMEEN